MRATCSSALYAGVCENDPPFRRMSLVNAELTKIAVNTYVTMKISYANTLADMCERLPGADVESVTDALGLDTRIGGKYLRGAIAYGGPCFPRDNKAFAVLARDLGTEAPLAEATDAVNDAQIATARPRSSSSHLGDGRLAWAILGLSYKPDTGVVDESPGIALAALLAESGVREVNVFDPVATDAATQRVSATMSHAVRIGRRGARAFRRGRDRDTVARSSHDLPVGVSPTAIAAAGRDRLLAASVRRRHGDASRDRAARPSARDKPRPMTRGGRRWTTIAQDRPDPRRRRRRVHRRMARAPPAARRASHEPPRRRPQAARRVVPGAPRGRQPRR